MPPKPELVDLSAVRAEREAERKEQCKAVHAQIKEMARQVEAQGLPELAEMFSMAAMIVEDDILDRPPRMPEPLWR